MTHQPDPDPGEPFPPEDEPPPADAPTHLLDGVPVGEFPEAAEAAAKAEAAAAAEVAFDVVVEMGHVPLTVGPTGTAGEQDFARAAAPQVVSRLQQDGRTVLVIDCLTLPPKSLVYLSIHCDGSTDTNAHGSSVGYRDDNGGLFAHAFQRAYQANGWSRGFRNDNYTEGLHLYYGTRQAAEAGTKHACIIEAGFLTNPEDRALLANPTGHARFAESVRRAVTEILGPVVQPPPPPPPPEDLFPALSPEEQARLTATATATNVEVGKLAIAVRDPSGGLVASMGTLRADVAAIRAQLGA